jgi:hypothetical protein
LQRDEKSCQWKSKCQTKFEWKRQARREKDQSQKKKEETEEHKLEKHREEEGSSRKTRDMYVIRTRGNKRENRGGTQEGTKQITTKISGDSRRARQKCSIREKIEARTRERRRG